MLHPLFHIKDNQSALRLFEIENEHGQKAIIEFKQEDLVSLTKFKQKVESLGNYVWLAKEEQLTRLKLYLYQTTETAELITQLGWQKKGFFAFGNGVFNENKWQPVDNFGIARLGEKGTIICLLSRPYTKMMRNFISLNAALFTITGARSLCASIANDSLRCLATMRRLEYVSCWQPSFGMLLPHNQSPSLS